MYLVYLRDCKTTEIKKSKEVHPTLTKSDLEAGVACFRTPKKAGFDQAAKTSR